MQPDLGCGLLPEVDASGRHRHVAGLQWRSDQRQAVEDDCHPDALRRTPGHLHHLVSGQYQSVSSDSACLVRFCIHCNAYWVMSVNVKQ